MSLLDAAAKADSRLGPSEPAVPVRHATKLSLVRGPIFPKKPPPGTAARAMPNDQIQGHPEYGLTPQSIVSIFRQAEAGWIQTQVDLVDGVVETDCSLRNLLDQRIRAVAGKPWVLSAAGPTEDDKLAARVLQVALRRLPMLGVWKHQLTHNRHGFAASEMDWDLLEIEGREWIVPVHFANVPHRRFIVDEFDQLRLLTKASSTKGEELAPGKWLVTRIGGPKLARDGLMRTAMWPAKFKRDTFGDWYIFGQRFGLPLILLKYALEGDEESKAVARQIIAELSNDGGALLPKDFEVEIHNEGRDGDSSGTHGGLIAACNREMAQLINGATLANNNGESGGASYSLGDVHADVRFENVADDAMTIQESVRLQVCAAFVHFNGLDALPPEPLFQIARDTTPKQLLENADTYVNKLGGRVSKSQMQQQTGLREPLDDGDALEGVPDPAPVAPATEAA